MHHKIIEYTSQDFEYTSQDIEYTSQDTEYTSQDTEYTSQDIANTSQYFRINQRFTQHSEQSNLRKGFLDFCPLL